MTTTATAIDAPSEERAAARCDELTQLRAQRLNPLDFPRAWTTREATAYEAETAELDARLAAIRTASSTLAELGDVGALTRWRDFLISARAVIATELLAIKSPIRDREVKTRADGLAYSLTLIDRGLRGNEVTLAPLRIGELMQLAGYVVEGAALRGPNGWRGSVPAVEQQIKTLSQERIKAERRLMALLLTDAERAAEQATHAAYRATLASMVIKMNATGVGLVAMTQDDEILDTQAMTDAQREAFKWFVTSVSAEG